LSIKELLLTNYKDTMNLPKTEFPMRANLAQREPAWVDFWENEAIHARAVAARKAAGAAPFILHDGPPYANGHIHMGTAYNKILKDLIVKYKTMRGYYSPYVPGWDCHGQPIEHKVEQNLGPDRMATISKPELREKCRHYALKWIDVQRAEFKRLGVLGNWDDPYLTLNHDYEAGNVEVFKKLYLDGVIYRGRKAIHWCTRCHTALAEAEIEYSDEASDSIYVAFKMRDIPEVWKEAAPKGSPASSILIWTTTPWTLPANVAVTLAPDAAYVALVQDDGSLLILARERLEAVAEVLEYDVDALPLLKDASAHVLELRGSELTDYTYERPIPGIREGLAGRIITGDHVDMATGTGAVHTAPGHGQDDYLVGQKWDLTTLMPVDDNGVFDEGGGPFKGLSVWDANPVIVDWLREHGTLLAAGKMSHSYPHCWRCKRPVIFRATEQWFVSMDRTDTEADGGGDGGLRERALAGFDRFRWIPAWSRNRMGAMIEDRPDWCISRQRSWGVPIPVHRCKQCGAVVATADTFDATIALFKKQGADAWFSLPPADYLPTGTACEACGCTELDPESDIVDVWWESGVSHTSVLEARPELQRPAQIYLEGSDQHRGWFQSSYLTSVGAYDEAPWENLMTHGFTVDGEGRKMSKSIGNVISPIDITNKYGADIIRLWVGTTDFSVDVGISNEILTRTSDAYRRVRNSLRFLLSNTHDFDPTNDAVAHCDLLELDKYWTVRLSRMLDTVTAYNDDWKFYLAQKEALDFLGEFSSQYLDVLKDRLYSDAPDWQSRRSAQTVLAAALQVFVRMFAPVLAFTCEEVWNFLPEVWKTNEGESVHLCDWPVLELDLGDEAIAAELAKFDQVLAVREVVTKALEDARGEETIGKSQEAIVTVKAQAEVLEVLRQCEAATLEELFIVGAVKLEESDEDIEVFVEKTRLEKCPRCWNYRELGEDGDYPEVCERCAKALRTIGFSC